MSKGIYFTFDGIFAAFLITSAAFLLLTYTQHEQDTAPLQTATSDLVTVLNTLTVQELPNATLRQQVLDTNLTGGNDTVLYAIGVLWASGDNNLAGLVAEDALQNLTPNYSYAVYAEGTLLYNKTLTPQSSASRIATSKQQVSGIAPGKPLSGSTATAYLRKVENKTTSSFAYFGGFVGQGNITVSLELPEDVDSTRVSSLKLELDTPQNFTLLINGIHCGDLIVVGYNMTPTVWDLNGCISQLTPGNNTFAFLYTNLSRAYIAGGYIKATYATDLFTSSRNRSITRYDFPQIEGVVNLYDAFVVPQTLRNLTVGLHYQSNDPTTVTYLTIGEKVVWSSNQTGDVRVTLTDTNLTYAGLDYNFLSNKTVPVRLWNFNSTTTVYTGGNADVVIITDYSGSMKKAINSDGQGDSSGNLNDCAGTVYTKDNVRRTELARCLDKEVVDVVLNITNSTYGNRVFPVYYTDNKLYNYTNPQDRQAILGHYTSGMPPQGKEKTCIACALSEAYGFFEKYNESNRTRFIILMSDGLPTHCTAAGCSAVSTAYAAAESCTGYCDTAGSCNTPPNVCTDSSCKPAIDNAISVAQTIKNKYNATIFTVGFGPVQSCDNATQLLWKLANMTNGTFQNSSNVNELRQIYQNISYSILQRLTLQSQTVQVPANVTSSILYNDSYITAVHDLPLNPPSSMIELTRQTPQFGGCSPTVDFPSQIQLQEAHIVSYSGVHWTDYVLVNGVPAFNLSEFLVPYYRLGDPYRVNIPVSMLTASNSIVVHAGDNDTDHGARCSDNNSMVYTALVPSATPRTTVLEHATGCTWTIERDDGTTQVNAIPADYTGANTCSYTNASISYDSSDALQQAVYDLLRDLDFDGDGRIFVSLSEENLEVIVTKISSVPYLWGPSLIEVRAWQ